MASIDRTKVQIPGKITIHAVHTQYHHTCHGLSVYIFSFIIYLTTVLVNGCKTWSFALREEHRM